jgi:methyl-accepting chemotaxis protein
MTDDAKEWVTVKVEKPVRDDAQDDPRTYSEIMRAGLNGGDGGEADPNDVHEQLDEIKRVVDQNNGALGDTVEQALTIGEHGFTDIADQLDRIESAAKEATNAAQNAERAAEELQR